MHLNVYENFVQMFVGVLLLLSIFHHSGFAQNDYDKNVADIKEKLRALKAQLDDLDSKVKTFGEVKASKEAEIKQWESEYFLNKIPAFEEYGKTMSETYSPLYESIITSREKEVIDGGKERAKAADGWYFKGYRNAIIKSYDATNWKKVHIQNRYKELMKWYYTDSLITDGKALEKSLDDLKNFDIGGTREEFVSKVEVLETNIGEVARRLKHDQFHEEHRLRNNGISGIKQIRTRSVGPKNYYSQTHNGNSVAAIHDHTNNKYTVGMGEFIGVIHGTEFRTRHNDYRLKQPPKETNNDNLEFIEFPDVPLSVVNKKTVSEQILEMREWFKAFRDQKKSVRDFTRYFKPVLVYLEGYWTNTQSSGKVDEPFESDRHFIDAKNWLDLQEKIRFTSMTGTKSALENLAQLPTKIIGFKDNAPIFSQWNYRIACHVLKFKEGETLTFDKLKLKPDTAAQMARGRSDKDYKDSRAAHFDLEGNDPNTNAEAKGPIYYSYLDQLMEQIPGRDNYEADTRAKNLYYADPKRPNEKLNLGYYHRVYKNATGKIHSRFFNDRLYVAHTTSEQISETAFEDDSSDDDEEELKVPTRCTYAIPLEIIYLTPLQRWNPYNIPDIGNPWITKLPEKGKGTKDDPFLQNTERSYYQTPLEFYNSAASDGDAADTTKDFVYAKNPDSDKAYKVTASGISILTRHIEGVGKLRIRYPIMNIHAEGNPIYQYFETLKEKVYDAKNPKSSLITMVTASSTSTDTTRHNHRLEMSRQEYDDILRGRNLDKEFETETANGHKHTLKITRKGGKLFISHCDTQDDAENDLYCFDHHYGLLSRENEQ